MDGPKVPDDDKTWESIDIFLFCNGQQYSPPRKYHLRCEELRWWDATIRFLAQSQYGSMTSIIQLYTLDGKLIQSPLELRHDSAYVAVKVSDVFIWAGYEEYIIKASRSREKRQEKLTSSNTKMKLDDVNSNEFINAYRHSDVIATEKTEGDVTNINKVHQTPNKDQPKDNMQTELANSEMPKVLKKNNVENDSPKRNIKDSIKNDMTRKNQNLKTSKKDQVPVKRKNSPLMRKANPNSQIKQLTSQNNLNGQVTNIDKTKDKIKEKARENSNIKNSAMDEFNSNKPINIVVKQTDNVTDSNPQSPFPRGNKKSEKNDRLDNSNYSPLKTTANDNTKYDLNKTISQQNNTDFTKKDKNINITLDIKLNGFINNNLEGTNALKRCESNITLISHKESQVNLDVVLNKENISYVNNVPKIENPPISQNNIKENNDPSHNNKFIVVYCKCDSKLNMLTGNYVKENMNLAFLLPIPEQGVQGKQEVKGQMIDKASQVSSSTSTNNKSVEKPDKLQEDTSLQTKLEEKCKTNGTVRPEDQQSKGKIDNFAQTDMSNTLLQVIREHDGHYTFCLPPLDLLKKYNVDTK